jgi:hypothetical protein
MELLEKEAGKVLFFILVIETFVGSTNNHLPHSKALNTAWFRLDIKSVALPKFQSSGVTAHVKKPKTDQVRFIATI